MMTLSLIISFIIIYTFSCLEYKLEHHILPHDFTLEEVNSIFNQIPFNLPTFRLCLGIPNIQCFNLAISTATCDTIIETALAKEKHFNHQYNSNISYTYDNKTIKTSMGFPLLGSKRYYMTGEIALDVIGFPGEDPLKGRFCFIEALGTNFPKINIDGYLGMEKFTYSNRSKNMLLELLYANNRIDKIAFALNYDSQGGGKIIMGRNTTNYKTCDTNGKTFSRYSWYCNISEISIGTMKIVKDSKTLSIVKFSSVISSVIAPDMDGNMILSYIHNLSKGLCEIVKNGYYMFLMCNEGINIGYFPMLILILQTNELILDWKHMMKKTIINNVVKYVSLFIVKIDEKIAWKIGTPGFIDHTIYFDKEYLIIGIVNPSVFNQEGILYINDAYRNAMQSMLIILTITLLSGVVLICLIKKNLINIQ